ncbi:uncharacterized protein LOC105211967 [Zeugodacus cucurbitae]|uniref:Uncharacterized protein n=1 Tax=Zeugodacus cucurbitae TaxID=28588 RepID=A0A0A1WKJ9_ZEUCU|nr:uncharacterized protein LOC105211967 [Zeugodacus cucurbitae]
MLQGMKANQLVLWLLLSLFLASHAIELLEQNTNELLELKATNATQTNQTASIKAASDAIPRQYPPQFGGPSGGGGGVGAGGGFNNFAGCPLCDSSVYSYCSQKMLHDGCCCDFPVPQLRPPQCFYTDCSLLYAKSCYEHSLIKNCCCNNPY